MPMNENQQSGELQPTYITIKTPQGEVVLQTGCTPGCTPALVSRKSTSVVKVLAAETQEGNPPPPFPDPEKLEAKIKEKENGNLASCPTAGQIYELTRNNDDFSMGNFPVTNPVGVAHRFYAAAYNASGNKLEVTSLAFTPVLQKTKV
jgi:hypothetical protein